MSSYDEYPNNGNVLLAAIISLSVVIVFILLLHAYARWLLRRRNVVVDVVRLPQPPLLHRRSLTGHSIPVDDGLDAKLVALIPMFIYKIEQFGAGMDCVICLSVMEEGEKGRVLPRCKHRFHVECIDMWLMSHSTCPICRDLVKPEETLSSPVATDDTAAHMTLELEADEGVVVAVAVAVAAGAVEGEVSVASSSSLGCSLKRMLSRSRSENRVYPSVNVNCSVQVS